MHIKKPILFFWICLSIDFVNAMHADSTTSSTESIKDLQSKLIGFKPLVYGALNKHSKDGSLENLTKKIDLESETLEKIPEYTVVLKPKIDPDLISVNIFGIELHVNPEINQIVIKSDQKKINCGTLSESFSDIYRAFLAQIYLNHPELSQSPGLENHIKELLDSDALTQHGYQSKRLRTTMYRKFVFPAFKIFKKAGLK